MDWILDESWEWICKIFANTDSINKTRRETRGEKFAARRSLVFSKLRSINKKRGKDYEQELHRRGNKKMLNP